MSDAPSGGKSPRYIDAAWPERWFFPFAHLLPLRFRRLPWFRKFYYQPEELEAAHREAEDIADRLGIK